MVFKTMRRILKNQYFAKTKMDRIAVCILIFGGTLAFWYEVFHVLPHYHQETSTVVVLHYIFATFLYVNTFANLYKLIKTGSHYSFAGAEQRNWPYCEQCCVYKPPRSHHCKICDVCILKRDHHCWFSGCCVGFRNHRYYLSMVIYILVAALYANIFHFGFVADKLGHLGYYLPICLVIPHFGALLGFLSFYEFLLTILTSVAFLCLVMFVWLFGIQVVQLLKGQTQHEYKKGVENYDGGFRQNIRQIMGNSWYVAWMWPWIPSRLVGDGITFQEYVKSN